MKKLYFLLFTFLIASMSFGQAPIITAIVDGDCTGGTPKLLEIYADGAVDFSLYSLQNQTNASTTWGATLDLSALGTVTDDFVYITSSADFTILNAEFPSINTAVNTLVSSTINLNGDDRIRIILTSDSSVIDQYGVSDVDGTGTSWEYLDSYAKRIDGTGPDGGFSQANWTIPGASSIDGGGTCQGGTTFESMMGGIGTYSTTGSTAPTLILIGAPPSGSTVEIGPEDLSGELEFAISNFTLSGDAGGGVSDGSGDGYIYWSIINLTDGGTIHENGSVFDPLMPVPFTALLPNKTYYIGADLRDNSGTPLGNPESGYAFEANTLGYNVVADIAALRTHVGTNGEGLYYEITGASLVTHTDGYQNRKWIQDGNISGLLISDVAGTITTTYNVGDNVTGLKGQTSLSSGGLLTLTPSTDSGVIASSGNSITPQLITIPDFNTNYADYESEIVELQDVTFEAGDGSAVFETGTNYNVLDAGTNIVVMRTDYFGANYIGEVIPTTTIPSLVAVAGKFGTTAQIYARSLSDLSLSTKNNQIDGFAMYPNPTSFGYINITSKNQTAMRVGVYDILGKQVINTTVNNNSLDVSTLTSGIYIMKISQDNATTTKKLIIK